MQDQIKNILIRAKTKITDPAHWCQKSGAEDNQGERVSSQNPNAIKWCAIGAVSAVSNDKTIEEAKVYIACIDLLNSIAQELFPQANCPIVWANDIQGHSAVLEIFDKAIAKVSA